MGLAESIYGGSVFDDIHNIYTRPPVSTPRNVLKNQNHLSRMVSFLGIAAITVIDNQSIMFLNASYLRYLHSKSVFRTNTRISMLNRLLLKYDKFINMLKGYSQMIIRGNIASKMSECNGKFSQ